MAWHRFLAVGLCASAVVVGCTVGTKSDDDDVNVPIGGNGGSATGGTGGAATGGTAGTATGGAAGGGTGGTATGGTGGGGTGGVGGSPAIECNPATAPSSCDACVQEYCCDEWKECVDPACAGTDDEEGELLCIIGCMDDIYEAGGETDDDALLGCATTCAKENDVVADSTNEVILCIRAPVGDAGLTNCAEECLGMF
jgi:hypothetical protein